jgi:hypothetical protein
MEPPTAEVPIALERHLFPVMEKLDGARQKLADTEHLFRLYVMALVLFSVALKFFVSAAVHQFGWGVEVRINIFKQLSLFGSHFTVNIDPEYWLY